jgi:ankyrin repeat protein
MERRMDVKAAAARMGEPMLDRIAAGRTDLIHDWLAQGGAASAVVDGASLLKWRAYYGDVSGLKHLLGNGAKLTDLGPNLGLNGAAFHGQWRLCEFLLENGSDPNFSSESNGETPLHATLCARESLSHEQVVRVLLAFGADPNPVTHIGAETSDFMRDCRTRGEAPLHRAAAYGTLGAIQLLLSAGAQIDLRDGAGDTPLTWASWALRGPAVLRLLCHDDHRIHPEYAGMQANLIGQPLGRKVPD